MARRAARVIFSNSLKESIGIFHTFIMYTFLSKSFKIIYSLYNILNFLQLLNIYWKYLPIQMKTFFTNKYKIKFSLLIRPCFVNCSIINTHVYASPSCQQTLHFFKNVPVSHRSFGVSFIPFISTLFINSIVLRIFVFRQWRHVTEFDPQHSSRNCGQHPHIVLVIVSPSRPTRECDILRKQVGRTQMRIGGK